VKSYLQKQPVDVVITRDDDTFISLKNRAFFANKKDADLFISIHCNASRSREAKGTRTYIYSRVASSKDAAAAAKAENKSAGALEFLMNDLRKGADEYLSIEAAGNIQHSLIKNLALKWLPTERAPFYVLANTNMPSVLVEAAFISNYSEASKLNDTNFRDKVASGISDGIMEYLQKIK
jgi:N-acetylmuramoyl-L-alanine amidase